MFDSLPTSVCNMLKWEARLVECSLEPRRIVDKKEGVVDTAFVAEFSQNPLGTCDCIRRLQLKVKEFVSFGIHSRHQPVPFIVPSNHCFVRPMWFGDLLSFACKSALRIWLWAVLWYRLTSKLPYIIIVSKIDKSAVYKWRLSFINGHNIDFHSTKSNSASDESIQTWIPSCRKECFLWLSEDQADISIDTVGCNSTEEIGTPGCRLSQRTDSTAPRFRYNGAISAVVRPLGRWPLAPSLAGTRTVTPCSVFRAAVAAGLSPIRHPGARSGCSLGPPPPKMGPGGKSRE